MLIAAGVRSSVLIRLLSFQSLAHDDQVPLEAVQFGDTRQMTPLRETELRVEVDTGKIVPKGKRKNGLDPVVQMGSVL